MSKAAVIPEGSKDIGVMKDDMLSPNEKKDGAMGIISRLLRFDSLGKRNSAPSSPTSTEPPATYYGVYIPCEVKKGPDEEAIHVYKNKSEALDLVRRYKTARFKAFRSHQEAVSFALRGAEPTENTDGCDSSITSEKPYPFKAPSPQDMVSLRKAIEAGLTGTVRDRVWDNPRYLVSSGSTPAILQEGSRYNALHVATKALNAEICDLILTTVGNPAFVQTLYGADSDPESCKEFAEILVDRYLNTPDKGMNETPLHFASKLGAEAAVDVLTSFAQCDTTVRNKFGETPKDIICKRAPKATPETAKRILSMLEERYYVPVIHTEDGSGAPTIGRPFTPSKPPEINQDPLSPRCEIRAFAGPMQATEAAAFRRQWKTPPRSAKKALVAPPTFRLQEMSKGLENVGRTLADEMKVGWKEYWPFLDTFTDLRSTEGMNLLEHYLKAKYESACSFAYSDSCVEARHTPDDLSISRLSFNISQLSPKDNLSPMSELCVAMKTCKLTDRQYLENNLRRTQTDLMKQKLCRRPFKKVESAESPPINHTVSQLMCIERTCQVFGKRIADDLIFSLTSEPEVAGESLKAEAKRLQHTIFTYMDDERFQDIDFALIHSRLAQLVVNKLKQQTKELDDINNLVEFLIKLRCPNDDIFSSDDERKPSFREPNKVKINKEIDGHVRCLASFICEELTESQTTKAPAISESECIEIWTKAAKCRCEWKIEGLDRNGKTNASMRKNRSALTGVKGTIRRLSFDQDSGDGKSQKRSSSPQMNMNSPSGDTALYTIDVAKCQVIAADISEDDSVSCESAAGSDDEHYDTAPEASSDEEMEDATDRALAEPFIYGEQPTKMDRLVYDCLSDCDIDKGQFPNVYRWRHTVALYSPSERNSWLPAESPDDSVSLSCTLWTPSEPSTPKNRLKSRTAPNARSTPQRNPCRESPCKAVPLQVSNWLRITGPNSPRSALAAKNIGHNVSFGF